MTPIEQNEAAKKYILENLQECAAELVSFTDHGILGDGKVRQASRFIEYSPEHRIQIVTSMIHYACLSHFAYLNDSKQ